MKKPLTVFCKGFYNYKMEEKVKIQLFLKKLNKY